MKRIAAVFLLCASAAFAGPFEDNYDKDAGAGAFPQQYYDDVRNHDGNYKDALNNYSDMPLGSLDTSDAPKDDIENDPAQNMQGYMMSSDISKKVSSENSLLSILKNLQSGGELETLGDTYVCDFDNTTYDNFNECLNGCQTMCAVYKFNVQFGCQYPVEVLRVSVPDTEKLNAAPPFHLSLKGGIAQSVTPRATAICINGMKSGKDFYTWNIEGNKVGVVTPHSAADVGECYDMTSKPFYTHYNEYYKYMGYSIQSYLAKLGYVASHTIDSYMNIVFSGIVSGACAEGVLTTTIPNASEIEAVRQGGTPSNIRDIAEKNDMYKLATESADFRSYTCSVGNNLQILPDRKLVEKIIVVDLPNYPEIGGGNYHGTFASNLNNEIFSLQYCFEHGPPYIFNYKPLLLENSGDRILATWIKILGYTMNEKNYNGCSIESIGKNESCVLASAVHGNSSIKNLQFELTGQVEAVVDNASAITNDSCSVPDDCKLENEYVCDMNGQNCVQTFKSGTRTGAKVPKMCSEVSTSNDQYLVCADGKTITATGHKYSFSDSGGYFNTRKEYKCSKPKEEKDYSAFLEQGKLISESASVSPSGDYKFTSIGLDGKQDDFTTNVTLKERQCVQTCKVKVQTNYDNKTVVLPDGQKGTPPPVLETPYYKPCVMNKKEEWECILDKGEKLVAGGGCSCPNDFVDIIVNLKFVDEAANGMICSDKKGK